MNFANTLSINNNLLLCFRGQTTAKPLFENKRYLNFIAYTVLRT